MRILTDKQLKEMAEHLTNILVKETKKTVIKEFSDRCKDAIFNKEEPFDRCDYFKGVNDGLGIAMETIDEVLKEMESEKND